MPWIDVRASVELPADTLLTRWALYWRQEYSGSWKKLGVYDGDSAIIPDMLVGTRYEIAVALVDGDGNVAPEKYWTIQAITPTGGTSVPPTPTNFAVVQDGEYLDMKWDDVSPKMRDFLQYEIRQGSSWADSVRVGIASKLATLRVKWAMDGAATYRLVTLDKYGKRSTEATASITITALEGYVDGTESDEDGGGFAGTHSGTEVDSGDLLVSRWGATIAGTTDIIEDCTWLILGPYEASYTTDEIDLGSERTIRMEADLAVAVEADARTIDDWHELIALPAIEYDGTPIDAPDESAYASSQGNIIAGDEKPNDIVIEIRFGTSSPLGTTWRRYIPGFYTGRYFQFRVICRSWNRWRRVRISTLKFKERKKNWKDEGIVAVVADPGPTTISFAASFISAPQVVATSDTAGFIVQVVSVTASGATLRVYDTDGSEVFTGNLYWLAAGT